MTVFAGSDIFNKCWQVVYNVISGNVTDPTSRGGSRWIYADFPTIQVGKEDDFPGYPLITIDNFQAESNNMTMGLGIRAIDLQSTITVFTKSRGQLDTINSNIYNSLVTKRADFLSSGLRNLWIGVGGTDTQVINRNNKIHSSIIPIRFNAEI